MNPPFARLEELFDRAVRLAGAERAQFLAQIGADDPALREEVEGLLTADEAADEFLQRPVIDRDDFEFAAPSPEAVIGRVIGGYTVIRRLGSGGMSDVYLAEKRGDGFEVQVALKLIRADRLHADIARRFVQERRLLSSLQHPNIARLLDGGATPEGQPFIVMEHVDGVPIDRYCADAALSTPDRLRLFRTVCDAVAAAHRSLVVHRDLKPSNILVTRDGSPKLLDFGIAKVLRESDDPVGTETAETTVADVRLLTPRYASPEQVRGGATTTMTDVYSLGVLLYELLTGRSPYGGDHTRQTLEQSILTGEPKRPSVLARERRLAGDLDMIVLMALRKEPERRYASVDLFAADIDRHLRGEPVIARPDTFAYRVSKFAQRNALFVGAAGLVAVLLVGFAISTAIQLRRMSVQRDRANREAETARQTTAFLENLFRVSDPSEARGRTITAREILDRGAATVQTTLRDQPLVQARMLRTLGSVHTSLGLYARADSLLGEAVEIYRHSPAAEERDLASALDGRANAVKQRGDIPAAIELAEEALRLRERSFGPDALPIAQSLNNLGLLYVRVHDHEAARPLLERAVAIRERTLGPDHPDLASTLQTLGYFYSSQGLLAEARDAFERALRAQLKSGRDENPLTAAIYSGLASVASDQGRHASAESLQFRSLRIKQTLHGDRHDAVATDYANLALIRRNRGDLTGGADAAERAVAIFRRSLGADHQHFATALFTLGQIRAQLGDSERARSCIDSARVIFAARLSPEDPLHAEAARSLADLERGRPDLLPQPLQPRQ